MPEYQAAIDKLPETKALAEAEQEHNESLGRIAEIADKILCTPAHTVAGIVVKIRAAEVMEVPEHIDGDFPSKPFASIASDIYRIAGKAQPTRA